MNKEHLARLQEKVNRLMRTSSEDSDSENMIDTKPQARIFGENKDSQPQTVRKCIDLIKENKQLKLMVEKQRTNTERLRKELQKNRKELKQQKEHKILHTTEDKKNIKIREQHLVRMGKLQAQLNEQRKRSKILEQLLKKQRKRSQHLSTFIQNNVPQMQQNLDRLLATMDAKMESYFINHPGY